MESQGTRHQTFGYGCAHRDKQFLTSSARLSSEWTLKSNILTVYRGARVPEWTRFGMCVASIVDVEPSTFRTASTLAFHVYRSSYLLLP